jgi:NTE family protein
MSEAAPTPRISLALQGGGTHGAFTWGVVDRLLDEVEAGRLSLAAISGASAGGINAALTVSGLVQGGAAAARRKLETFWGSVARAGLLAGNFLAFGEPGPSGWNIDSSPAATLLGAANLLLSPYTNPFYTDPLIPLIKAALPADDLARLNAAASPRLFISATNVRDTERAIFRQPDITLESLRASATLPMLLKAAVIGGVPYWDGGYLGNPPLTPLIGEADDILIVMINPLHRDEVPRSTATITERINEVTFNASLVLEVNAIEAVNRLLRELADAGTPYSGRYKQVNLHLIRNEAFMAPLGYLSKYSTSWNFLLALRHEGRKTAEAWLAAHYPSLGKRSSFDVRAELTQKVLAPPA